MGLQIEDGKGSGEQVAVSDNKLEVDSSSMSRIYFRSKNQGDTFTWSNVSYDYDANDTILLVKNTSRTKTLVVTDIFISGDTTTPYAIHIPECDNPTGTSVTAVNPNRDSGEIADATAVSDETTNTQANVLFRGIALNNTVTPINTRGSIRLGLNDCVAVDFATDGTAAYVVIAGFYE